MSARPKLLPLDEQEYRLPIDQRYRLGYLQSFCRTWVAATGDPPTLKTLEQAIKRFEQREATR